MIYQDSKSLCDYSNKQSDILSTETYFFNESHEDCYFNQNFDLVLYRDFFNDFLNYLFITLTPVIKFLASSTKRISNPFNICNVTKNI